VKGNLFSGDIPEHWRSQRICPVDRRKFSGA